MAKTPEAKRLLSSTVRGLRDSLLADLEAELERTYRFAVRPQDAGLGEAARIRRRRLDEWTREQARAERGPKHRRTEAAFRSQAVQLAAATLLNRLVVLRMLEAGGLRKPAVVTGGWESRGYLDFREIAQALVQEQGRGDASEGYAFLLRLVFEELATDLPGLFGPAGVADLVPIPAPTLRHVIESLGQEGLASCWTDDLTLGWVYQYWNDPERERLDTKLNAGGNLEPHEIASKTQMFTERYIVDWLLQNSLGPTWLAMCRKHGWTAADEVPGPDGSSVLDRLEARRVEWRAKRDAGEVSLTELMPLDSEAEERWAYYVPQPIPEDAVAQAPESVRDLRILDPAVGSGHFLVVAFDLLVALYREEAGHRGEVGQPQWSDAAIVERILEHNLHGIDLDPRAVQIAAAALWLKAQRLCREAQPQRMNLVASNLRLAALPDDDPALVELRQEVEAETGIPGTLTGTLVHALQGADHLGSLLRVDQAVERAIRENETKPGTLFKGSGRLLEQERARQTLLGRLEGFLARHGSGDDLGLRLRGEQLAAGVRFVRMLQEGQYDLVVGNPPYQGTGKMADTRYVEEYYTRGKANLYAAFLERGLQLVRTGGMSALLTIRTWMFVTQFAELRKWLLESCDLRALGDFDRGAFEELAAGPGGVSVAASIWTTGRGAAIKCAIRPSPLRSTEHDLDRKRAATLCQVERYQFEPDSLKIVPEWPLVYWWDQRTLRLFRNKQLLGAATPARATQGLYNNNRFTRTVNEVAKRSVRLSGDRTAAAPRWVPFTNGADGLDWFEPLRAVANWACHGMEPKSYMSAKTGNIAFRYANEQHFFTPGGIAYTSRGSRFSARLSLAVGIFGDAGRSIFAPPSRRNDILCLLNSSLSSQIAQDLNPTVNIQAGDVNRLPMVEIEGATSIVEQLEVAFMSHESHREGSIQFSTPGPSPWRHAQEWAQEAVDRPEHAALPVYESVLDLELPSDHLSFAIGVALGRFGPNGEGTLDPAKDALNHALPAGICFLDGTLDPPDHRDSVGHPAAKVLATAWEKHGLAIDSKSDLRTWLRLRFFGDVHKGSYENRPIHWPLSSTNRTFVAWINIHRWTARTLRILLADHLAPALTRLDGELADLRAARAGADATAARAAERRYDRVLRWREELAAFIEAVEACADQGPPPTDAKCPGRERDVPYDPDLDDGVLVNSAALWPLLEPQWKDPKKWWKELATAEGRKDYDWSHLAMLYWPKRVDAKCRKDPSLGVAHGCFWRYHPERAWAWELRLQDEIGPDFRIEEPPYRSGGQELGDGGDGPHRESWIRDHAGAALDAVEKEAIRRMGRGEGKQVVAEIRILESGIWSALPLAVWEMELRLAARQKAPFALLAPDEEEGRQRIARERPDLVKRREKLWEELAPRNLFSDSAGASPA